MAAYDKRKQLLTEHDATIHRVGGAAIQSKLHNISCVAAGREITTSTNQRNGQGSPSIYSIIYIMGNFVDH